MVSCASCGFSYTKTAKERGITFHHFSKFQAKQKSWRRLVDKSNWQPGKNSYLCSQHFAPDCFDRSSSLVVRLRDDAVPTIKIQRLKYVRTSYPYMETATKIEPEESSTPSVPDTSLSSTSSKSSVSAESIIKIEPEDSPAPSAALTSISSTPSTRFTIVPLATPLTITTSRDFISKSNTPSNVELNRKIGEMAKVDILKSKKIRLLQQTVWRQRKRILSLKNTIKELRQNDLLNLQYRETTTGANMVDERDPLS